MMALDRVRVGFPRADPFVVVFAPNIVSEEWEEVGRTETLPNTLNPDFAKPIRMNFHFGTGCCVSVMSVYCKFIDFDCGASPVRIMFL
ncbi:MAG: hypothetical protein P4L40_08685 [Terracidiphilus sp.]|nr:hypothetical protein [Terracidiphilus sp.]